MKLDKISVELEQLSALAGGWKTIGRIDDLERDLALEKLRRIYEAVRFAASAEPNAVPESGQAVKMPVNLDLDQMLGVIPMTEEEPGEKVYVPEKKAGGPASVGLAAEAFAIVAEEPFADQKDAASLGPETGGAPVRPEPVSARQESVASVPERSVAVVQEAAPVSETASRQPAAERPTVIEPGLFGMDEIVQHKRKQRVIMSLYDEHPGAARTARESAGKPEPSPCKEPELAGEESGTIAEPFRISEPDSEPVSVPETKPEAEAETKTASASAAAKPMEVTDNASAAEALAPGAVLGEVINRGVQTLGETIASPRDAVSDMAHKAPVTDLREAIGINDKFLLIRDLFDGDAAACDAAIDTLNGFDDLDDCMIHIAEHYAWNPNSDGARLLVELLERKLA